MTPTKFCSLPLLVTALLAGSVLNSFAPIFIKYEGVDGEATAPGHVGESDVICFNYSLSRSNTVNQPTLNPCVITKTLDKASAKLAEACANGQHYPRVILSCRKAGAATTDYYKVVLEDVVISNYQLGPSCATEAAPTESVSLNFTKITWTYEPQTTDGVPTGPPVTGQWPPPPPTEP